jgi:hypothetical protein
MPVRDHALPRVSFVSAKEQNPVESPSFGPTSGSVTGWFGLFLCAVVVAASFLAHDGIVATRLILAALLAAVVIWAFLLRSRVIVGADAVVLRNSFVEHTVPYSRIDSVDIRTVTCVYIGDKRYVGAGVGHSVRALVRRNIPMREAPPPIPKGHLPASAVPDFVLERIRERMRMAPESGGTVTRKFAVPEIVATVMLAVALVVSFLV